jgi:hypothetical protein
MTTGTDGSQAAASSGELDHLIDELRALGFQF